MKFLVLVLLLCGGCASGPRDKALISEMNLMQVELKKIQMDLTFIQGQLEEIAQNCVGVPPKKRAGSNKKRKNKG